MSIIKNIFASCCKLLIIILICVYSTSSLRFTSQKVSHQRKSVKSFLSGKQQSSYLIYQRAVIVPKLSEKDFNIETRSEPPRLEYFLVWIGLLVYAFGIAPGGSPEAAKIDASLIEKLILTPYDGTTNPILVAIFNFLGILPAVYASLLLPGSKKQPILALPFVLGSFGLGFFGVGPYLGARTLQLNVLEQDKGRGSVLFESKLSAVLLLGFGSFLTYYMLSNSIGDFATVWSEYLDLFKTQRLVNVSTIDFTILSLAVRKIFFVLLVKLYKYAKRFYKMFNCLYRYGTPCAKILLEDQRTCHS